MLSADTEPSFLPQPAIRSIVASVTVKPKEPSPELRAFTECPPARQPSHPAVFVMVAPVAVASTRPVQTIDSARAERPVALSSGVPFAEHPTISPAPRATRSASATNPILLTVACIDLLL